MGVETLDRGRQALEHEARRVSSDTDAFFRDLLKSRGDGRDLLFEAMRHAAIGGGKRLRPLLAVAAARLFGIARDRAGIDGLRDLVDLVGIEPTTSSMPFLNLD